MVSRKGLQELRCWEMWAELLNHWWWHGVCDHCGDWAHWVFMEFAWDGGFCKELAVGGSLEGGSGPGDESWMQSLA